MKFTISKKCSIMKNIMVLSVLLISNFVFSQTYYGKNDFGKFEFINDSVCTVSFLGLPFWDIVDTCSYIKNQDTIFLSSKIQQCEIKYRSYDSPIGKGYPVLMKIYEKRQKKYELVGEVWDLVYDTLNKRIVWNKHWDGDALIVIRIGPYYDIRTEVKRQSSTDYFDKKRIIINIDYVPTRIYFDSFPLLLKGNKLIPLDKTKNETCWIENGFYFPIMRKSEKVKEYETIVYRLKGLIGLPSGYEIK